MVFQRISSYRIMMILVIFDLPTETKAQRREANKFRIQLKKLGFRMMQLSCYIKSCYGIENYESEVRKVEQIIPAKGEVCILTLTEKQYNSMKYYFNQRKGNQKIKPDVEQLRLF